jgi:signal transduction histidine kinase/DNA-binding response OmpR family regulator/ligand-binding sensor domain-containing protein
MRVTNSICKDDNGFIWASSKTGILRLTEDDYKIYQLPYESAGAIFVRLVYENKQLVAFTNNGQVFIYNQVSDNFEFVVNFRKLINTTHFDFYHLLIDDNGAFWIAVNSGLYRYHSGELKQIVNVSNSRLGMTWFGKQKIVVATDDGIFFYDINRLERQEIGEFGNNGPSSVSALMYDKTRNDLWLGTLSKGLFRFNLNTGSLHHILESTIPQQPILALTEISDSTFLAGIDGQGVWELDKRGERLLNVYKEDAEDPYSLRGNGIYDIFYEPGKRVWIGTISGGVCFYDLASPIVTQIAHHANDKNSLANNDVNGIAEDKDGKIWFATNNGISCWNVNTNYWSSYYYNKLEQAQVFLALLIDNEKIWVGSYSSGFYIIDRKTGRETAHYFRDGKDFQKISNFIFDFLKDSDGDTWIGGVNGDFLCYSDKYKQFKVYPEEPISSFAELEPGQILIGTSYGMSLLNKQTGEMKNLLTGILVQDILVQDKIVWICTSGGGLLEYNFATGELNKYTTENGLPSNFVNSIIISDGYIWIGTENGLCRFNPADRTTNTFQSIVPLAGISYNKSAVCKLKNGQLVWGTNNGAVIFFPESLKDIPSEGRIYIQDLTISGRSVREIQSFGLNTPVDSLKSVKLRYFQNTINVELIPLGVPPGAKFAWKLDGFDKEWSVPANNRTITYTNLPSGSFTLNIRMLDNSMTYILSERSIDFRLVPPFWRKTWFWGVLIAIFICVVVLYILLYINGLKQKHTEEKVRFFTNTAHDIRTSLTLIKAPVEELNKENNLSEQGKYYLQLALKQTRQMDSVVTQLMDFQKADIGKEQVVFSDSDIVKLISSRIQMFKSLAESKNIQLQFQTDCDNYRTAIDESKIEKVIDNLISNAIKYSNPGTEVKIDLKCGPEKWKLEVIDRGIGISRKAQQQLFKEFYRGENAVNSKVVGSGIGLLLVKKYVNMHSGNVTFESQENSGSTFRVIIPFKEISGIVVNPEEANKALPKIIDIKPDFGVTESHSETQSEREMKIMVVEDNDDLLKFMQKTLENEFRVLTAMDGSEAWKIIQKQLPDLIVSDVMMPGMDGFELCRQVKSAYETSHIPIILLTALSEKTNELKGLGLGADDYITKPFDMNLLVQRIRTIIHNRQIVKDKALKMISINNNEPLLENVHNDKFVKKLSEVVKSNMANSAFDKEEFAQAMNVSTSLLYKKMKALTDTSPTDFIKIVRLNHALELLQSRKYSVTEVSELCGFASVGYFSTVFKKHFRKSPTDVF